MKRFSYFVLLLGSYRLTRGLICLLWFVMGGFLYGAVGFLWAVFDCFHLLKGTPGGILTSITYHNVAMMR